MNQLETEWDKLLDHDWGSLGSFSLNGAGAPHLLNRMNETKGEEFLEAFFSLSSTILSPIDEGVVFEITPKVVPCLTYLMRHSSDAVCISHIAVLLSELAIVCDPFYYCYGVWTPDELVGGKPYDALSKEVVLLVQERWTDYLPALDHGDVLVRIATIRLLSLIPPAWPMLKSRLETAIQGIKQPSDMERQELATMLISFAHCQLDGELDASLIEKFCAPMSSVPNGLAESAATIAMAIVHQEATEQNIITQLCHVQQTAFTSYPSQWYRGHLNEYADDLLNIFWPEQYDELHL